MGSVLDGGGRMSKGREHGEWASPGEVTEGSFEREHFCKVKTRGGVLEV